MSFKLLIISSMYPGYLESFYKQNAELEDVDYNTHYNTLLMDSTEFVASYTRTFKRLGVEVKCIVDNDSFLQDKWRKQNGLKGGSKQKVIYDQVKHFRPEVLWIEDLRFVDKNLLEKFRTDFKSIRLIIAYHCSPYNSEILNKLRSADFVITCTPGLKNDLEFNGIPSYLVYHGFDTELLVRISTGYSEQENGLVFTGSLFQGDGVHSQRIELIETLLTEKVPLSLFLNLETRYKIEAKKIIYFTGKVLSKLKLEKVKKISPVFESLKTPVHNYNPLLLNANQGPVFGLEMYQLLARSGIVLNIHGEVAGNYAGNMRLFEATGVGSCLLTDNKSNLTDLFDTEKEIVTYDNADDCGKKVKWLLENSEERKTIAEAGQKRTLNFHKVDDRCRQIIEIIENNLRKKQ